MWTGSEWIPAPPKSPEASANVNLHDSVISGDVSITHNEANPDAIGEGFKKAILDLKANEIQEKKRTEFESEQALLNAQENRLRFKADTHIVEITTSYGDIDEPRRFFNGISDDEYPCSFPELRTLLLSASSLDNGFWGVRINTIYYSTLNKGPITEVIQYYSEHRCIRHEVYDGDGGVIEEITDAISEYETWNDRTPAEAIEYLMTAISMHMNGEKYGDYPQKNYVKMSN